MHKSLNTFSEQFPSIIAQNAISEIWAQFMLEVFNNRIEDLKKLNIFVSSKPENDVLPKKEDIWAFTKYCPSPETTRVVIIGQDPYFNRDVGYGLGFSVRSKSPIPPSLKVILQEVQNDISDESCYRANLRGFTEEGPTHGCLDQWAKQGVVMLDTAMTVDVGVSGSHIGRGWENIIACIIHDLQTVVEKCGGIVVFMLWGSNAKYFKKYIREEHKILEGGHPSPLNERNDFLEGKYFSKANDYLVSAGREPIDWSLDE